MHAGATWQTSAVWPASGFASKPVFAAFLRDTGLAVFGESGEAAIWTVDTGEVRQLPISYSPITAEESIRDWASPDGIWLIINDSMRGLAGYRLDGDSQTQRFYPLNLPLETSIRESTSGGRLTADSAQHYVAFGDSGTDAILLEPSKLSLTTRLRRLRGHDSPVTSLSFTRDGNKLFTTDLSGSTRWWDTAAQSFQALPIALAADPENPSPIADNGNFVVMDDVSTALLAASNGRTLLVGAQSGYSSYDLGNGITPTLARGRRQAAPDDFPPGRSVPPAVAVAAFKDAVKGAEIDDEGYWDAELLGNRVLALMKTDSTVSVLTSKNSTATALLSATGKPIAWRSHAVDVSREHLFVLTPDTDVCRADAASPFLATCFQPSDAAAVPQQFGETLKVISANRLIADYKSLIDLDETTKTYTISPLVQVDAGFCGTTGFMMERFLYRLCDAEAVVFDLQTPVPQPSRLPVNDPPTALTAAPQGNGVLLLIGTNKGRLIAYHSSAAGFVKSGAGQLDSRSRISATEVWSQTAGQSSSMTIVSSDRTGDVWRWDQVAGDGSPDSLIQAVRLHAHRGAAGMLAVVSDGQGPWVASAGADGLVLLSPMDSGALLARADEMLGAPPANAVADGQPAPPRRVDGTVNSPKRTEILN